MKTHRSFYTSTAAVLLASGMPAQAQTETPQTSEEGTEIIVTAQRRSQKLSEVPISIQAVDQVKIRDLGIRDLQQVQLVTPGLTFNSTFSIAQPFIRGVGANVPTPGLEPPIATYVDEFYSSRSFLGVLDLVDIGSVEILRGPQGTLYGRNATGGALLIRTNDPTSDLGASFEGRYGRFNEVRGDAVVNLPLGETLALRVAGRISARDGYITNPINGEKWNGYRNWQLRGKLKWSPNDRVDVIGTVERAETRNYLSANQIAVDAPACVGCLIFPGAAPQSGFYQTIQGFHVPTTGYQTMGELRVNLDLDEIKVSSITGYRKMEILTGTDQSGVGGFNETQIFQSDIDLGGKDYSQELRVQSEYDGPLNFLMGANWSRNSDFIIFSLDGVAAGGTSVVPDSHVPPVSPTAIATFNRVLTRAWSIYGEVNYNLTDALKLTAGGRYNEDRKRINGFIPAPGSEPVTAIGGTSFNSSVKFTKFTPRVILSYDSPGGNYYVSYNQAFKSGGFDTPSFALGRPIKPEKIDSIEFGAKNSFVNDRLRTRLAAFYYFYKDIQVAIVDPTTTVSSKQNADGAKIYGMELDIDWAISREFSISAGGNLLHAKFKSYPTASIVTVDPLFGTSPAHPTFLIPGSADATGTDLPYAPKATAYVSATYKADLSDTLQGRLTGIVRYSDGYLFTPLAGGTLGVDRQGSFTVANLSAEIGPSNGAWAVGAYAENFTGTKYLGNSGGSQIAFNQAAAPPATYGLTFRVKY